MVQIQRRSLSQFAVVVGIATAVLSGCAGSVKNMREVPPERANYAPTADKGVVVFMRPSGMAFAIQSSIFDVTGEKTGLVGIIAAKKRVAYSVSPGKHNFMVVSEAADFMSADIQAGKTYYVFVTPRMGAWKARFSLLPIHKSELQTNADLKECTTECAWVELSPESVTWAQENLPDIDAKRKEYFAKWMEKSEADRPALNADDGR